jgi:hypothetical protein
MRAADFRIAGLPPGWFYSPVASPIAESMLGDPLGEGATVSFATCQGESTLLLLTITGFAMSQVGPQYVQVLAPTNGPQGCDYPDAPTMTACTAPAPTTVCMPGSTMLLNQPYSCQVQKPAAESRAAADPTCEVAVDGTNWGFVKSLYRD